ncbi:unnamed protein product [Danaus chrysippus]|uniref:(African queen) hypothetical protein n=1 Tax=Danaus chrysippus TaxID=151541 RepID=A0A8J2VUD1_9NEOP|nr:unnamed protein product [Danaus chrysippus]
MASVYIEPNADEADTLHSLEQLLSNNTKTRCINGCDFNGWHPLWGSERMHARGREILELSLIHGLLVCTHIRNYCLRPSIRLEGEPGRLSPSQHNAIDYTYTLFIALEVTLKDSAGASMPPAADPKPLPALAEDVTDDKDDSGCKKGEKEGKAGLGYTARRLIKIDFYICIRLSPPHQLPAHQYLPHHSSPPPSQSTSQTRSCRKRSAKDLGQIYEAYSGSSTAALTEKTASKSTHKLPRYPTLNQNREKELHYLTNEGIYCLGTVQRNRLGKVCKLLEKREIMKQVILLPCPLKRGLRGQDPSLCRVDLFCIRHNPAPQLPCSRGLRGMQDRAVGGLLDCSPANP